MRQRVTIELPLSNQWYNVDIIEIHIVDARFFTVATISPVAVAPVELKPTITDGLTIFTNIDHALPMTHYVLVPEASLGVALAHVTENCVFIRDKKELPDFLTYDTRVFLGGHYHLTLFTPNSLTPLTAPPELVVEEVTPKGRPR